MSKRKYAAYLDIQKIEDVIASMDITKDEFFERADIGKSTWHRIKRSKSASIPISCSIAYALGVAPNDIIIEIYKKN